MNMQQLREAFAAWRKAQTGQAVLAYNLVWLLTDPTPITEEGLRELGFEPDRCGVFRAKGGMPRLDYLGENEWAVNDYGLDAKATAIGQLRGLLLFVGE